MIATVGVDVGGERKGFHAVAIVDGSYSGHFATKSVLELATWCRETVKARVIAIDAPCRWRKEECARLAELQLTEKKIGCFWTPTPQKALTHRTNHYGWMLRGEALYQALEPTHTLCQKLPLASGENHCFETFPHAITWHLTRGAANAKQKGVQRRQVLRECGIDTTRLTNIDFVDAALCALVAHQVSIGKPCVSYGEPDTGFIVVPFLP